MSELTKCNRCRLEDMKANAEDRGVSLIVEKETEGDLKGWISARYSDSRKPSAWFMALTENCDC